MTATVPVFFEGDFGRPIRVRVVEAGVAVDISAATTRQIILRRVGPTGTTTRTLSASFLTSGVDGVLTYTPTDATTLTPVGAWMIRARAAGTGFDYKTAWALFVISD